MSVASGRLSIIRFYQPDPPVSSIKINEMQGKHEAKTARITVRRSKPVKSTQFGVATILVQNRFLAFF
jgi:hypothetical protein